MLRPCPPRSFVFIILWWDVWLRLFNVNTWLLFMIKLRTDDGEFGRKFS